MHPCSPKYGESPIPECDRRKLECSFEFISQGFPNTSPSDNAFKGFLVRRQNGNTGCSALRVTNPEFPRRIAQILSRMNAQFGNSRVFLGELWLSVASWQPCIFQSQAYRPKITVVQTGFEFSAQHRCRGTYGRRGRRSLPGAGRT